jgi:hypothetical protein
MLMSCKDVTRLVSQGLDRKLGFGERIALRMHVAICAGCENVERQMALLREAVRRLGAGHDDLRR